MDDLEDFFSGSNAEYLLFTQTEAHLSHSDVLKRLVKEVLSADMEFKIGAPTATKLVNVIIAGALDPFLKAQIKGNRDSLDSMTDSATDSRTDLIIGCLKVIQRGFLEFPHGMLLPRLFALIASEKDDIASNTASAITSILKISWKTSLNCFEIAFDYVKTICEGFDQGNPVKPLKLSDFSYSYPSKGLAGCALLRILTVLLKFSHDSIHVSRFTPSIFTLANRFYSNMCIWPQEELHTANTIYCHNAFLDLCTEGMNGDSFDQWIIAFTRWIKQFSSLMENKNNFQPLSVSYRKSSQMMCSILEKLPYRSSLFYQLQESLNSVVSSNLQEDVNLSLEKIKGIIGTSINSAPYSELFSKSSFNSFHDPFIILFSSFTPNLFSLDGLKKLLNTFSDLPDTSKCFIVKRIGLLACASVDSLDLRTLKCFRCDVSTPQKFVHTASPELTSKYNEFIYMLMSCTRSEGFSENSNLRIEALKSFKRIVVSFRETLSFDFSSDLGLWLVSCLRSTIRDLRVAVV